MRSDTINHLWTAFELKIGFLCGSLWLMLDVALGGIDTPIRALAILIILDFITGVSAGFKKKELSSSVGAKGILKKVGVFFCITVACLVDSAMGLQMFRGMVISGFAIIEAMSLVENIDRLGYGFAIPEFLRDKLKQIADEKYKGGK